MQVRFVGEEGLDDGGIRKEFFMLLLREILNPDFGMFVEDDESHYIWFRDKARAGRGEGGGGGGGGGRGKERGGEGKMEVGGGRDEDNFKLQCAIYTCKLPIPGHGNLGNYTYSRVLPTFLCSHISATCYFACSHAWKSRKLHIS